MDQQQAATQRQRVAEVFDRVVSTYDAVDVPFFTPIAERLVQELDAQPGERALDIGCGRGAALFPLAAAVGPAGHVTGVDLSAQMVVSTRTEAGLRGLKNVELAVMDAAAPTLSAGVFDVAASSLVLFFLPDPLSALQEWRTLLVTGGRLGISTFGSRDPRWVAVDDVFRPFLPPQLLDPRTRGETGPFASDVGVASLFADAGFTDVRTVNFALDVRFVDEEQWREWSWSHGQRVMWESVPTADHDAVRATAYAILGEGRAPDGSITLSQQVRLTIADNGAG